MSDAKFDIHKIWSGSAYSSSADEAGTANGFVGVELGMGTDKTSVSIMASAYDQGEENTPMSITVELSLLDARAYAKQILDACEAEQQFMQSDEYTG